MNPKSQCYIPNHKVIGPLVSAKSDNFEGFSKHGGNLVHVTKIQFFIPLPMDNPRVILNDQAVFETKLVKIIVILLSFSKEIGI